MLAIRAEPQTDVRQIAKQVQVPAHHRHLQAVGEPDAGGAAHLFAPAILHDGEHDDGDRRGHEQQRRERALAQRVSHELTTSGVNL